jgi:hypothetical protein
LKTVGPYHFYIYIWPTRYTNDLYYTIQILGYTKKKPKTTHMVVTKNKDGMDLCTMRENDNYN